MVLGFEGRFVVSTKWIGLILVLLLAAGISSVSAENETNTTILNITLDSPPPTDILSINNSLNDGPQTDNLTNVTLNETSLTPLSGEITQFGEGYYVLLGEDSEDNISYNLTASLVGKIQTEVGSKVILEQTVEITNLLNVSETFSINLWDHVDDVLTGSNQVNVYVGEDLLSEQPIFFAELGPEETITYNVEYVFPEVKMTQVCTTKTVRDLLPPGASVLSSKISLDLVIEETCTLVINHNGAFYYADIVIPLDMLSSKNIQKITHKEGNKTLEITEQTLVLTR